MTPKELKVKSEDTQFNQALIDSQKSLFEKVITQVVATFDGSEPVECEHPDIDKTYDKSDKMNAKHVGSRSLLSQFFNFLSVILSQHNSITFASDDIQPNLVVLRDQAFVLAEKMIESKIFQYYQIGKYRYLEIFTFLDSVNFEFDYCPEFPGTNSLILEILKMMVNSILQVSECYNETLEDPSYLNLIKVDAEGHEFKEDIEQYCSKNLNPFKKLLGNQGCLGFRLFEQMEDCEGEEILNYCLSDEIIEQLEQIIKMKLAFVDTAFDCILKGYSDAKSYSGLTTEIVSKIVNNGYVYRNSTDCVRDLKNKRAVEFN